MKRIVEEVSGEGLEGLLDKEVVLFCLNYFYTGKLTGVNTADVRLDNAYIIYETGPLSQDNWEDAQQPTANPVYVRVDKIESYWEV
jgi:hypothetical protein